MSNDSWCTPPELYNPLHDEFKFEFDLCADEDNTKCTFFSNNIEHFIYNIFPVLIIKPKVCWINPPYSRNNIDTCMNAVEYINNMGIDVVSLTRFDPSANWFKKSVDGVAAEVRMLDKRVKFVGASSCYPFPCCISIYRGYIPKSTNYYIWGWK